MKAYALTMELAREPNFRLGGMDVRPSLREIVFVGGREVLEPRVMAVLVVLGRAKGEVVTRDDLTAACWGGRAVSDDAINRVISRIRRVAGLSAGKDFTLETITKVGYRLVAGEPLVAPSDLGLIAPASLSSPPAHASGRGRRVFLPVAVIAVLAVLVATGAWWLTAPRPAWTAAPNASLTVAVLPFDHLGDSEDDARLAIGMSREVRNTLSRVRGLKVVSDSSSFAVAFENLTAKQMRETLWADLLVDGSLTRTAEQVKLTAELVDASTGNNLWTGSQAGPSTDLNKLQQLLSSAIFEQIVARAGPNRLEQLAPPRPSDPRVYRMTMEGYELFNTARDQQRHGDPEAALDAGDEAHQLALQALKIDPNSADALALIGALVEAGVTSVFNDADPAQLDRFSKAAEYMRLALAADPDNGRALQKVAEYYRRVEWRWSDARQLFERALALNPNDSIARVFYAFYLSGAGRCREALENARIAEDLDPVGFRNDVTVPRMLTCLGRLKEADALYDAVLKNDPRNLFVLTEMHLRLVARREPAGLRALALRLTDELWGGKPPPSVNAVATRMRLAAHALEGRTEGFRDFLRQDVAVFEKDPSLAVLAQGRRNADARWTYAVELAAAGETALAIDMLRGAIAGGSLYIPDTMPYGPNEFTPEMRASPRYQAIWRNDPRLVELMRLRLEALEAGEMAGVLPNGQSVSPKASVETRS
jgi:TolB-like protein/DNA-binding winged helix-turn-helix (wHTH) protein